MSNNNEVDRLSGADGICKELKSHREYFVALPEMAALYSTVLFHHIFYM